MAVIVVSAIKRGHPFIANTGLIRFGELKLLDKPPERPMQNKQTYSVEQNWELYVSEDQRVRWLLSGNTCCIMPAGFIC